MLRLLFRALSLSYLVRAVFRGPVYLLRFLARHQLRRGANRWIRRI
jgi:hypothetical protein